MSFIFPPVLIAVLTFWLTSTIKHIRTILGNWKNIYKSTFPPKQFFPRWGYYVVATQTNNQYGVLMHQKGKWKAEVDFHSCKRHSLPKCWIIIMNKLCKIIFSFRFLINTLVLFDVACPLSHLGKWNLVAVQVSSRYPHLAVLHFSVLPLGGGGGMRSLILYSLEIFFNCFCLLGMIFITTLIGSYVCKL